MLAPDSVRVEPPDFAIDPPPVPLITLVTATLLVAPPAPAWTPREKPFRSIAPETLRVPLAPVLVQDCEAPSESGKLMVSDRPAV